VYISYRWTGIIIEWKDGMENWMKNGMENGMEGE